MPDNLTVQISADSSKLRADLKLAEAAVKDLNRQLNTAAREARRTGDRTRVDQLSAAFEGQLGVVNSLRKEYAALAMTSASTAKGMGAIEVATVGATRAFAALKTLLPAAGIAGAVLGAGKAISVVTENLTDLRNTASAAGLKPLDVQVFQEFMQEAGIQTDSARRMLVRFTDMVAETRQKLGQLGKENFGVNIMRGAEGATGAVNQLRGAVGDATRTVNVFRGGVEEVSNIKDPLGFLKINPAQFKSTTEMLVEVARRLVNIKDQQTRTALGVEIWGKQYAQIAIVLERIAQSGAWDAQIEELIRSGRAVNENAIKPLNEYEKAWDDLRDAVDSIVQPLVISIFPALAAVIRKVAEDTNHFKEALLILGSDIAATYSNLVSFLTPIFEPVWAAWRAGLDAIGQTFTGWFNWMIEQARAVAQAISSIIPGGGSAPAATAPIPPPGQAAGGLIRGPGSGTSDSILARLSNGEFVMRAAAVRHWGTDMMEAMNAFHMPRFAAGGLATTGSGGTPVHLHLGSQSFALAGAKNVVDALITAAHQQHVKSAGVKPSWYGGR